MLDTVTPESIGYAVVSLGLVIKGALDIMARYKTKSVDRGCLYGDEAHDKLGIKMDAMDKKREYDYKEIHGMAQEILILVRRLDK